MRKPFLTLLALGLLAGCGRETFTSEADKSQVFDTAGVVDSAAWDALCKMQKQPPGCDLCATMGWYSDGTCDTFCQSADPDCSSNACGAIPRSQMSATATSAEPGHDPSLALDGTAATFWHTPWDHTSYGPTEDLPQSITLSLGGMATIAQLGYTPPDQVNPNGIITRYIVSASADGSAFTQVAQGTWAQDLAPKSATFTPVSAAYVRLQALEGDGGFAAAGEITVSTCVIDTPPATGGQAPLQGNVIHVNGNDSSAIATANAAAGSGDTVFFDSGTYSVTSTIAVKSGVLYHADPGVTLENSAGDFAFTGMGVTGVIIDGFTIDHGAGITFQGASTAITVINNNIQNNDLNGWGQVCLYMLGGNDVHIHDNTFASCREAFMFYNIDNITFAHNNVHDTGGNGVSGVFDTVEARSGVVFDSNTFDTIGRMGIEMIDDVNDPRPAMNGMQITNNTLGTMGLAGGENIAISVVPCKSDGGIVISGNTVSSATNGWAIEVCTPNGLVENNTVNGPIAIACSPGLQIHDNVINVSGDAFLEDGGYCGGETVGSNTVNGATVNGSGF